MSSRIVFRRGSSIPNIEFLTVGEPIWDVDKARLGLGNGESQPRWYPCIDINGNLILNPSQNIISSPTTLTTYLAFNGTQLQFFSNGNLAATWQDVGNTLLGALTTQAGITASGAISFPGFTITSNGTVNISGQLNVLGGLNLSLSQFAASVLPTVFTNGNILIAGSPHTWQDPKQALLLSNTTFASSVARTGTIGESLKLDFSKNFYSVSNTNNSVTSFSHIFQDLITAGYVTFTRSSQATYFSKNGSLAYSAINQARIDYDPYTGARLGLLLEGPSQNTSLNSTSPTTWTTTNTTFVQAASGFSNWTAKNLGTPNLLYETTTNTAHNISQTFSYLSEVNPVTFSTLIEWAPGAIRASIAIDVSTASTTNTFGAYFDISNMTVGTIYSSGNGAVLRTAIRRISSTIYRLSITGTTNILSGAINGAALTVRISGAQNDNGNLFYTGLGGNIANINLWQIEVYDKPSSLIVNTGVINTRSADNISIPTSKFSFDNTVGTFILSIIPRPYVTPNSILLYVDGLSDISSYQSLYINNVGTPELTIKNSGSTLYDNTFGPLTANTANVFYWNYLQYATVNCNKDGIIGTSSAFTAFTATVDKIVIGQSIYANNYYDGWVNFLSYTSRVV